MERISITGKRIDITKGLCDLFIFLGQIEAEIKILLNMQKKLLDIKEMTKEIIDAFSSLICNYPFEDMPAINLNKSKMMDETTFFLYPPILRSQVMVIFCYLDTIFSILSAYDYKTKDKRKLIELSKKNFNYYVQEFLLTNKNGFYKKNSKRFCKITPKSLKNLRNNLIHFFTISNDFGLSGMLLNERIELENGLNKINTNYLIINGEELFSLLMEGSTLVLRKFNEDSNSNPDDFNERIAFVKDIIKNYASKMIIRDN